MTLVEIAAIIGATGVGGIGVALVNRRSEAGRLAIELLRTVQEDMVEVKTEAAESRDRWHECEMHRAEMRAEVGEQSARHDAEMRALRDQVSSLRRQSEGALAFEIVAAADGSILNATDSVEAMLGWRPIELAGRPIHTLMADPTPEHHEAVYSAAVEGGRDRGRVPVHGLAKHRSGATLPVHVIITQDSATDGYWAMISHAERTLFH